MTWWDQAVGYEVYLRSFADGDDNGIGDFAGLTRKLDYIASLEVDAIWVTPFYPSPQADYGYDVADYTAVDPIYGTLDEFDLFVARAHELELKVLVDIVPNHSSAQHPYFLAAMEDGPGSQYWDYYVWRDPRPDGGPPNNWFSIFGGPAWSYVPRHGKYYMHLFLPEQPDFNWANPAVHREFERILRFWVDRNVDGFRIDVAHSLVEHPSYSDNPLSSHLTPGTEPQSFGDLEHLYDIDQPEVPEIFRAWRRVVGPSTFLVGEVYLLEPERVRKYVEGNALHRSFYFALNRLRWDPVDFAERVKQAVEEIPSGWGWIQGSHDEHRAVTRYGGGPRGVERSLAFWVALLGLPGTPFLYQGEELGLEDGVIATEDVHDPVGLRSQAAGSTTEDDGGVPDTLTEATGRDPCRTPMPWTSGPNHGFSTVTPWLPSQPRPAHETVEHQEQDDMSPLNRMRDLLRARRETSGGRTGPVRWIDSVPGTLAFARDGVAHVSNLTDEEVSVPLNGSWALAYRTGDVERTDTTLLLAPRSGAILTE